MITVPTGFVTDSLPFVIATPLELITVPVAIIGALLASSPSVVSADENAPPTPFVLRLIPVGVQTVYGI
jgi:hypothetical protein